MRATWRDKAFTVFGATVAMVALPVACFALRNTGPAGRVVFYAYFPVDAFAMYVFAAVLGAALGKDARLWLGPRVARSRPPRIRLAALAGLMLWALLPQLQAFPAHAGAAERDAWARDHVREYPALKRIVATTPELQRDVGRIVAIAPTANDDHSFAREMDGDDMRFTLDVIGVQGAGTFRADCTLDESRIYEWRSGRWKFGGHEIRIDKVVNLVPR